jgi:high-affinity K+ transport system ATPase subunit B
MKIILDNAQSGGPQIVIENNNIIIGKIYLHTEDKEGIFWSFNEIDLDMIYSSLSEMPNSDGILLYSDEK